MAALQTKWLNWVVVLRPTVARLGDEDAEELLVAFESACSDFHQGIVINLADVHAMGEVAFGVLMRCWRLAERAHTKMALCCVTGDLRRTFLATGLVSGERFGFETEEAAVRYCSKR